MYWINSKWSYIIHWTVNIIEHLNEFIEKFNIQWRQQISSGSYALFTLWMFDLQSIEVLMNFSGY